MGKAGNKSRKNAKLAAAVMNMMDPPPETDTASIAAQDAARAAADKQELSSLELLYGKKEVPLLEGPSSPAPLKRVVDLLGRPLRDQIPPAIAATKPGEPVLTAPVGSTGKPAANVNRPANADRTVTLMRDHLMEYPDLFLSVFVAGDRYEEAQFAAMFARTGCKRAPSVLEADLVVFTGGSDVDPALYGEEAHSTTRFNEGRDTDDINLFLMCQEHGIPMFGVCRGAQFLHVMMGGKLVQDIDEHYGDHSIYLVKEMRMLDKVSSVHHQMCIQNVAGGMDILATSSKAKTRWLNPKDKITGTNADVEAFFYRSHCIFGVQGHPEYRDYNAFANWCITMLNEYIILNPDMVWEGKTRRLKEEFRIERDALNKAPGEESIIVTPVTEGEK